MSGEPALEIMKNPAALYMEGFRSVSDLQRHMQVLSEEQKKVISYFDEMEKAGPIKKEEADQFLTEIEKCLKEIGELEGAEIPCEVVPCGSYRRG